MQKWLSDKGVKPGVSTQGNGLRIVVGRIQNIIKVLGLCRPERLMDKFDIEGCRIDGDFQPVMKKEDVGLHEVVTLSTSTKTYIAEGYAAHNSNKYHHVYILSDSISSSSVSTCINQLTIWSRTDPKCNIEIIFNSPGGSIIDGMLLYDFIQQLKRSDHEVTTVAMGMAASMAGVLLQAGTKRAMGAEAWVLIHEASFMAAGSMGNVEDQVEWVKKMQERILGILAKNSKMSVAQIKRKWTRKDWWLSSDQCLEYGFVDEVR